MHIPDGFISPHLSLPAAAAVVPLWLAAVRRFLRRDVMRALPLVGSLTAVAFVIQSVMIPDPGGTSVHLSGCALIAVLRGPLTAFVCQTLVLLIQSVVLGMGGITVLPINALALGLLGPTVAWGLHRLLARLHPKAALFAAGYGATAASATALAAVLCLQHAVSPQHMPIPAAVLLPAILAPHLAVVGVIEGLYTALAEGLLRRVRVLE